MRALKLNTRYTTSMISTTCDVVRINSGTCCGLRPVRFFHAVNTSLSSETLLVDQKYALRHHITIENSLLK